MSDRIPQGQRPYASQQYQYPEYDSQGSSSRNTNTQFQQNPYSDETSSHRLHEYGKGASRPESYHRGFGGEGPNNPPNPLSEFLANFLRAVVDLSTAVSLELYTNSSVIVLAAGLAGGVHHFASPLSSLANAAMDASFHGSVAVAKYVGLAFFIKTAQTPIHEAFTQIKITTSHSEEHNYIQTKAKDLINSHVVSYLTPMALAWIVAYTQGIPVRLGFATVYTIGTFGMMKVLSRGYDYALSKMAKTGIFTKYL